MMRIGGIASGIDTESIIRDMMAAQKLPLNKITQKKQYIEWQLDDYRSANRDIRSMRDGLFDMTRKSTYMAKSVSVSNENAVNIRALGAESEFSGEIEVTQLAKSANWQQGDAAANSDLKESDKFTELRPAGVDVGITITVGDGEKKTIKVEAEDTIKDVVDKINKQADVNAFFDEKKGKIAMTAKNTGDGQISVTGLGGGERQAGQDAEFKFNGLETSRSSNTFTINGFEITLKEETTAPVTFSSAPDVDKVFDAIKSFVDDYNKLITDLNEKVREPKFRDFHPLSAEQKADMKEKEIELWEEKAMSGTLRNDPMIQSLLTNMRMAIVESNGVKDGDGKTMNLASLGITPIKDHLANGMLEINETKLREAISADPNKVYEILGKSDEDPKKQGIIHSVRQAMQSANETISRRAGSVGSGNESFTLGRNIKEIDKQIERFEERLARSEERLWRQFSAMEQAMNRANAQAQQLMSGLGGMM